jgi:hypothetical protein
MKIDFEIFQDIMIAYPPEKFIKEYPPLAQCDEFLAEQSQEFITLLYISGVVVGNGFLQGFFLALDLLKQQEVKDLNSMLQESSDGK